MKYDIAVIGGGPAGIMAAGRAGELGANVVLLEKNDRLGIKLLMTGHGRCNLTNLINETRLLASNYGSADKFLLSAFHKFSPADAIAFFEERGLKTKLENDNRVFPVSDRASDVLNVLAGYLSKAGVEVKLGATVKQIVRQGDRIEKLVLTDGRVILADKFIVATGGKSYPVTGSNGEAYAWLRDLGHSITTLTPALTPVVVKEKFIKELEGLSFGKIAISLSKDGQKIESRSGEAIFTSEGLSGPLIHNLSRRIGQELPGELSLVVDFAPAFELEAFDRKIQEEFRQDNNKSFKNSLDKIIPRKLMPVITALAGIDPDKKVNLVTREERQRLLKQVKAFSLTVKDLKGFDRAMVTAGGVRLAEVESKTMKSKIIANLYLAGELLDLDGPSGGYNLQLCWSTGYAAGEGAAGGNE